MDILTLSFYFLFLIAFPLGEIARIQFGNGLAVTLLDIFVTLSCFIYIFSKKKDSKLFKPILLFVSICVVSLVVNIQRYSSFEFLVSFLYILRFTLYAGVYFAAVILKNKEKVLTSMIFSGFIIILLGFIQYFFYPYLGNLRYLGWDEHLFRLFSSFLDPNFAGAFFVLYLFLCLHFISNKIKEKKWKGVLVFAFFEILALFSLFLTYSRTAYLMLGAGILTLLVMHKVYRRYILALLGILVIFGVLELSLINKHSEGTNLFRVTSTFAREKTFQEGLTIFSKNLIIGIGFNAYRYALHNFGFISGKNWETSHGASTTDNSFLFVSATTGIIGLLFYVYLWYRIVKISLENNEYKLVLIPTFVSLIVGSMFVDLLFYSMILVWIWALLGVTENN